MVQQICQGVVYGNSIIFQLRFKRVFISSLPLQSKQNDFHDELLKPEQITPSPLTTRFWMTWRPHWHPGPTWQSKEGGIKTGPGRGGHGRARLGLAAGGGRRGGAGKGRGGTPRGWRPQGHRRRGRWRCGAAARGEKAAARALGPCAAPAVEWRGEEGGARMS